MTLIALICFWGGGGRLKQYTQLTQVSWFSLRTVWISPPKYKLIMALQNSSDTAYQRLTFKSFKLSSSTCTYTSYISQNCNISISMISFIVGTHGWLRFVALGTKRNQPWVPTMDKFIQSCHIPIRAGSLWIMRNVWQYMYGETRENCTPFKLRIKHFFSLNLNLLQS